MSTRGIEIAVGLFVMMGIAALFMLALRASNFTTMLAENNSYPVYAHFSNIGGLKPRASVAMAGVRVGRVASIQLDPTTYDALVTLAIDSRYNNIPIDSNASILTAGLLGEQYIGLQAGGSDEFLKSGDTLQLTQSALVLENLVEKFLYSKTNPGSGNAR